MCKYDCSPLSQDSGAYEEDEKEVAKSSTGVWKPELHYVWDIILNRYLSHSGSDSSFQDFYRIVVDGALQLM